MHLLRQSIFQNLLLHGRFPPFPANVPLWRPGLRLASHVSILFTRKFRGRANRHHQVLPFSENSSTARQLIHA
jgi:hypothetical protein